MDEKELRSALRTTMTHTPEPPPMPSEAALAAARRAARRRNLLACSGAAAALVAVTAVVIPAQRLLGTADSSGGYQAAGPPAASAFPTPSGMPQPSWRDGEGVPAPEDTKPSWPAEASGDATFDTGGRYQKGKQLLDDLLAVVPKGYGTPTGKTPEGLPQRDHQATVEDDGFGYLASTSVTKDGGTGQLLVEVHTAGNKLPTDPCALAATFWGMGGTCEVERTGGAEVGVATQTGDRPIDQWAAYRHADGTVVFVAQAKGGVSEDPRMPPLARLPLGVPELAKIATGKRFHLR